MQVITISGHAQHGKDTTASILSEKLRSRGSSVLITHYGDLVKYVCTMFFGWNGEKDAYGRSLLQKVGTDIVRNIYPNYWVDFIVDMIRFFGDQWDYVLIPDTRFPNEIECLIDAGIETMHVRVDRGDFDNGLTEEQKNHPSETLLNNYKYDWMIQNNGTIDDLEQKIDVLIKEKLNGKDYEECIRYRD